MNFPIVREYKTDLLNSNKDNEQRGEPFKVKEGKFSRIIIPVHSPFFADSLKMYFPNGKPMDYDKHYRIYRLMPKLTDTTAARIACMIELLDDNITEGTVDYDILGHFSLFDSTMMNLIRNAVDDDRPVWWENLRNKPTVFRPQLHGHSLIYEVLAFQDLIELMDMIVNMAEQQGRPLIQIKIETYFDTFVYRLNLYRGMIKKFLDNHTNTYNEHGLTAIQVNLEKVDNFATAIGGQVLENRTDLHLTVQGLQTIIDRFGFNSTEFLKAGNLPISQFGNSNFIPPNISGSFEGLGGVSETSGISMESDGSLVFLWNRFDGRVNGLYYSVIQDPYSPALIYTGYRYTHPRLNVDNASPDVIVQGSGAEVILVGDSSKELFYVGLTNGSLDPAKHVYSKIDLSAFLSVLGGGAKISSHLYKTSVVLMGGWIYIFLADSGGGATSADFRYRYFYRVSAASVAAQLNVTATPVNVSFQDGDGVQWANTSQWRWCTPVGSGTSFSKWYFNFNHPASENICFGAYRGQTSFATPVPGNPGKFLLKFASLFWVGHLPTGTSTVVVLDMTYQYDPVTGVMTLVNKTPNWTLDPANPPALPEMPTNAFESFDRTGLEVLNSGEIVFGGGQFGSYPRLAGLFGSPKSNNRYNTLVKNWSTDLAPFNKKWTVKESPNSPLESGVKPKAFMLGNGGDFYTATNKTGSASLFYRSAPGPLAIRPTVSNMYYSPVRSRPLSNDVRRVNLPPVVGGFTLTMPSNYLNSYGVDVGEHAFCVSCQKKYLDGYTWPTNWSLGTDPEDVMLVSSHTRKIEVDGTISVIPTGTILYPSAIVQQLKQWVADIPTLQSSPKVFVTICDPSGFSGKYGWLPTLVFINYVKPGTTLRYATTLSINATYSGAANKIVTSVSLLNAVHGNYPTAVNVTPTTWNAWLAGEDPDLLHGAMRAGYYLHDDPENGFNKFNIFFDSGVIADGLQDTSSTQALIGYVNRTGQTWSTVVLKSVYQAESNHYSVIPDNGVDSLMSYPSSTGGAASIFMDTRGSATPASMYNVLGSVYPEVGWVVFFQADNKVTFNGRRYIIPAGMADLRDIDPSPANKTFFIYAVYDNGNVYYDVSVEKRLESAFQLWVGRLVTNNTQIVTIERFNVVALNGHRVSEAKRGSAIPATSGLINVEGQLPWLRQDELLP